MIVVKRKKQKTQKRCHNLKIIKTIQKQLNLKRKKIRLKKQIIDRIKEKHKEFIKKINQYQKHRKDLKVKGIMLLLKKLIRFL